MGKFDGILICSDWDGTLSVDGTVVAKSAEAIRYFQDNGGLFTIASGRYYPYLEQFYPMIQPNTYAITLNGAVIRDQDRIMYSGFLGADVFDLIDRIIRLDVPYSTLLFYPEGEESCRFYTVDEYLANKSELMKKRYYKMLFRADTPELGKRGAELVQAFSDEYGYDAVRSWASSLEIVRKENNKGAAIKRLKAYVGAHLSVAVGDYENDISMLRDSDVGYAVNNATDTVKAAADRVTVSAEDGAIASIIADLEQNFL